MDTETREFNLSVPELQLVLEAVSADESLKNAFNAARAETQTTVAVVLDRENTERVREYLTLQLAQTGFSEDYSPTERGHRLEDLIDRFYWPPKIDLER